MAKNNPPVLVRIKYPDHHEYFIFLPKEKRFVPLDEKYLAKEIPGYCLLNEQARQRALRAFIKQSNIAKKIPLPNFIPSAPSERLSPRKAMVAAKGLLSISNVFELPSAGYMILSDILCGPHCQALRQAEPDFRPVISLNSNRPEIMKFFKSLLKASVVS